MIRWVRITGHQYFGFFALGLLLFALQEAPYMVMPFISLDSNTLMEMQEKSAVLNILEKALGVSCIVSMLFLVRDDVKWFSLCSPREYVCFGLAMLAIAGYFVGWIFYFLGYQSLPLILCCLAALPPAYYTFIGLWRRNYVLSVTGVFFLAVHMTNVWNNLKQ